MQPSLTLVGAGPGDAELLTIKAHKAIARADVLLYDALINPILLEIAPKGVPQVFVGKRCRNHAYSQEEINALIVKNAMRYGHCVRLKGGDPYVFGRGYEEKVYAESFGIPVEVISGISSAVSVPASIGIPLTARGISESFWVITGTTRIGKLSEDIYFAARSSATVVILMGMHQLEAILEIFMAAGKAQTPMAIIQNGTTPEARWLRGLVGNMGDSVRETGIGNPAVMVIGEVVGLGNNILQNEIAMADLANYISF